MYRDNLDKGNPFDLVIMDLTIPGGMGGKATLAKILEMHPEVKAIVASGYSNDPVMSNYADYGFKGVISKPFLVSELNDVIQSVLES